VVRWDYDVPGFILRSRGLLVDIGGYQAFFAYYAVWRGLSVLTFAPYSHNVRLLRSNLEAINFANRVKVITAADKAIAVEVRLFRTDRLGGAG
jgi:hypothetical protein